MKRYLFLLLCIMFVSGCYYTFTPNLPVGIKSISVPIFENNTLRYGLETTITSKVVDAFIKDGNLGVKDAAKADSILHGRILNYQLDASSYTSGEVVQSYRITMTVAVSFEDRVSGEILWQEDSLTKSVTYYIVQTSQGPAETEAHAAARLMDDISEEIVRRTIEGW